MNELASILEAIRSGGLNDGTSVLTTVVHVVGSAYRRPGARMLILPDGRRVGSISGGCLEGDVARKAAWWTSDTGTALRTFDNTTADAAWEFGLGCNGVITVLLERLEQAAVREMVDFLAPRHLSRSPSVVATVIRSLDLTVCRDGDRLLHDSQSAVGGKLRGSSIESELAEALDLVIAERAHRLVHLPEAEIFVEWIGPPQRLVILGAGHDVIPVVSTARQVGWTVWVADRPSLYVQSHRFPGAAKVLALPASGEVDALKIDADTAVVVMSHNYPQDLAVLPYILKTDPRYLGLLGPKSRAEKLFKEVGQDIRQWNVYAPVGLDLGSDCPETMALSIISEIQAVLNGRSGGPLKDRSGPIHNSAREWRPANQNVSAGVWNLGLTPVACSIRNEDPACLA